MLKTIALIGLAAAVALPSAPAFAVSGNSSAYGTDDYGPTVPTQSLTPFQRSWNHANESKERARAGAAWVRHHWGYGHSPCWEMTDCSEQNCSLARCRVAPAKPNIPRG